MQISITFTKQELEMIARALIIGMIHTNNEKEEMAFKALEQKITVVGQLSQ